MVASDVTQLVTQLAEVIARNAGSAVLSKISAIRARKLDQSAMNELIELVNDLIADKNELIGVATAFEQELVAQQMIATGTDVKPLEAQKSPSDTLLP